MNRKLILFFITLQNVMFCALSCYCQEADPVKRDPDLSKKVVRRTLNQSEPADVKVGLEGITTIEFPAKIEAITGYGFALQPKPDTDEFQLTYEKGTNFLSLKALRAGVSGNLTVVINEKVYCLYCEQDSDPSFVVIFAAPGENGPPAATAEAQPAVSGKKVVSREQLLNFLDKVKEYSALKTASRDSVASLSVAEPNKSTRVGEIETVIKRVVRDDSLDLVGFEVQLSNRGQSDFYFDPQGFGVRVGDAKYQESISDAGGIVPAGTSVPAFFVVTVTTNGGRNDLSVDQNFDVQIQPAEAAKNPYVTANFTEPVMDHIPTQANTGKQGGTKASHTGKGNLNKPGDNKTENKTKQGSAQADAKNHAKKTQEPAPKKHWFDIFKHNSVTSE
jgi:hypothetical protein